MQIKKVPQRLPSWQLSYISFNTPIDLGSIIKSCTLKLLQVPVLAPGLICVSKLTIIGSDIVLVGAKPLSEPMLEYC